MDDLQFVTEFMLQNFQQVKITKNGTHFLARCLLCGDSKKNPYKRRFNLDWNNGKGIWHCFNCGRSGSFLSLYAEIYGLSIEDAIIEIRSWNRKNIKRTLKKKKEVKEKKIIEKENFNWIINDCYSVFDRTDSIVGKKYISVLKNFIYTRKIDEYFKVWIAYKGKYKGRIIIPVYDKDHKNVIYFQGRRIPGSDITKYKNPPSPKEIIIPNKGIIQRDKSIVATEGLIDAYMMGTQGTSFFGKEISKEFVEEILKLTDKDVIIALDNDKDGYIALRNFIHNNDYAKKLKYFLYPQRFSQQKDINKIVVDHGIKNVYDIIVDNSFDYSTAYAKVFIYLKLLEDNNENNKYRNRYSRSKRR